MAKTFTTILLSNGDTVTIDEITGGTLMQAAVMGGKAAADNGQIMGLYLLSVAVRKKGESVGWHYIDNMSISDINVISEILNTQLVNLKLFKGNNQN